MVESIVRHALSAPQYSLLSWLFTFYYHMLKFFFLYHEFYFLLHTHTACKYKTNLFLKSHHLVVITSGRLVRTNRVLQLAAQVIPLHCHYGQFLPHNVQLLLEVAQWDLLNFKLFPQGSDVCQITWNFSLVHLLQSI